MLHTKSNICLKIVSTAFLQVCFLIFLLIPQKLFSFSRKSGVNNLDFQISWRHQMIKHKTRNTFLLNNLGSKHSLLMKFGQYMSYSKRNNFIKKFYKKFDLKTGSRPFCVCKESTATSIGKWNFWSNVLILDI